mgnify:CR=1 FL=1
MKAMTLRLPDEVHEALRQRAFGQRTSITEIVRQAIDERLTWIDAESSSWCADCRFEEGDNPACCAALAAVPADGETEPLDAVALDALPIGTVLVDPFDSAGDAPVVVCKNANRLWASAPTDLQMITFTSSQVLRIAGDRVRVVYRPIPEGSAD